MAEFDPLDSSTTGHPQRPNSASDHSLGGDRWEPVPMTEKKTIQGTPDTRESLTGSGSIERKSQNSAEISTATPGSTYNPPPMSMDSQQTNGND